MSAFPRNSIRNFLVHAKSQLHTAITNHERVTLVIGNESAGMRPESVFVRHKPW